MALRVKAKAVGFRNGMRVRQGEEFSLEDGARIPNWVEVLGGEVAEPKRTRKPKATEPAEPEVQSEQVI